MRSLTFGFAVVLTLAAACGSASSGKPATTSAPAPSVSQDPVAGDTARSRVPATQASTTRLPALGNASALQVPAAGAIEPCHLVTQAEAEAAIGLKLSPGADSSSAHLECHYQDSSQDHGVLVEVSPPGWPGATAKAIFSAARAQPGDANEKSEDIPGIGDAAFFATTTVDDQVGVLTADRYYVIRFEPAGTAGAKQKLTALAKQALSRR